jgi:hypothetical protein
MTDKGAFNSTYVNTSFNGNSDANSTSGSSLEIDEDKIINGVVKVDQITANGLEAEKSKQYITFWFKPDVSGSVYAKAKFNDNGVLKNYMNVEIPDVSPRPQASDGKCYIPLGRTSKVYCDVTGRGETLSGVFVRLYGCGYDKNGTSDVGGVVSFSITPASTGNISIDVGTAGRVLADTVVYVTSWVLDVKTDITTVEEGGTFTVTVMKEGTTEYVEGADVTFNGETLQTDANGQATFTAPQVTSDRDFTITSSKIGYAPEPDTVSLRVTNTPGLTITISGTQNDDGSYQSPVTVTVSNEDTGALITGAAVTFGDQTGTTVNGQVAFTAADGTYTVTASFGTFDDATPVDVTIEGAGIPGFELLTLIAALGVAFILLRRRRK